MIQCRLRLHYENAWNIDAGVTDDDEDDSDFYSRQRSRRPIEVKDHMIEQAPLVGATSMTASVFDASAVPSLCVALNK